MGKDSKNNDSHEKDEIFRSAVINGWITNSIERDKSLITLSSGGIGLLVTLLSFKEALTTSETIFYALAFTAFIVNILSVIVIFSKNPDYMKRLITEENVGHDSLLGWLDITALTSFFFGVGFTTCIGVTLLI